MPPRLHLRRGRVLLTEFTPADAARMTEICQDPDIQRWTMVPVPYTRADADFFTTEWVPAGAARGDHRWAIRLLAPGHEHDVVHDGVDPAAELVKDPPAPDLGHATLHGLVVLNNLGEGLREIGYWIAPEARGGGVMTTAVDLALTAAERELGTREVRWDCLVVDGETNWPSWRVAWKLGFRDDGLDPAGREQRGVRQRACRASWRPGDPRRPRAPWNGPPPVSSPAPPELP